MPVSSVRVLTCESRVCTAPDDRVPGPRSYSLLAPVEFPWREAVNAVEEIASPESFEKSLQLCRNGLLVGPSSGLALLGLLKHLNKLKEKGELDQLRNEDTGEIPCMFRPGFGAQVLT